ncbi:MAG: 2-oxo acid dehydrogenase subunit E2 [Actinobacteria bacterium]|nr:2-oxo acid dehydrogenase subunit E2 [Actinomycetota bacterium]
MVTVREIRMPLMGEMISEGTLVRWLRGVGDFVAEGEPLFDVSTEKVETEVVSPISGTLSSLLVAEGETVPIGTVIAEVDGEVAEPPVLGPVPTSVAPLPEPVAGPRASTPEAPSPTPTSVGDYHPFTPIRRVIGQRLTRSLATAAHTLAVMEVDYERVEVARRAASTDGERLTYLPFVGRAIIDAIVDFPMVNAHVSDDGLELFGDVDLGIAVDVESVGLLVPVVRAANALRLRALAHRVTEVSARVRAGELSNELLAGGTITLTNPGGTGTVCGRPIINIPQAAIVELDGVRPTVVPVPGADGGTTICVRRRGNLSLSYDHRAFDGLYACSFLRRVVDIVSEREWIDELS